MKKRNAILVSLLVVFLLAGIGTGALLLVCHEPGFYGRCMVAPGPKRVKASDQCFGSMVRVWNHISNGEGEWRETFTQDEVNSFLEQDLLTNWPDAKSLQRKGIWDIRIAFEPENHIRLGFRYGNKPWQTIMSFDMRLWLVPKEINVLAIELVGRHAGALPVSAQSLLTLIAEQFHSKYADVSWYRHNGNPVALVRFQSDAARPTFQLREVKVEQGVLTLAGKSLEPGPQARVGR